MLSTKKFTQEEIKEINRVNVINYIKKMKTTTKQDIAKDLAISIPTVTTNINELIDIGLVEEVGIAKSTGGRKPVVLGFVKDARYAFGVSITRHHVLIRLINLENEVIEEEQLPYIDIETTLLKIEETVQRILEKHQIAREIIVGVGLSLPGVVDDDQLILEKAPTLQIKNFSFRDFQKALDMKVFIENEANLGAFAESKVGSAVNMDNLVYVSVTEGIGTGIIIKSHIYKSNQKKAGEFGHTRISTEPLRCNCGRTGCWELYASKDALIRYYMEASNQYINDIDTVFEAYNNKSEAAKSALKRYVNHLFYGIENIILGLNPDYVVIGGDLGKYQKDLKQVIKNSNLAESDHMYYEGSQILFSVLEDKGQLVGAALLPLEDIFNYNRVNI